MLNTLNHHLAALPPEMVVATTGDLHTLITAPFVESSQAVQAGGVFIARRGLNVDGHRYIPDALERGAVAIIGEHAPTTLSLTVPYVQVTDAQATTGYLAASYHNFPSRHLVMIGVTGTDGKTTTTHLIHSILKHHTGGKAGFISTIAADFGTHSADTGLHVTTPSAPEVQAYLAQMLEAGLTHVVLEMTSHGLAQGRLNGVALDVAVMTNITHEHLDFHGSWEAYRDAKALMFRMLENARHKPHTPKLSVINADDPSFSYLAAIPADTVLSYSINADADYRAQHITYAPDSTRFTVNEHALELHLMGEFNVYNALAALTTAKGLGVQDDAIRAGLADIHAISGRMERLYEGQDFIAMVDFAHTPNALKRALEAGRKMVAPQGRLIAVFGSAGLRDVEKRRLMAEVSAQLADFTVLTAEDPRTESLLGILDMMAKGCEAQGGIEGQTFIRVMDRGRALYVACQMAQAGDVVMACGKGHEQSMCFGTIEYAWDDRTALRAALRGEPLRTLPTAQDWS